MNPNKSPYQLENKDLRTLTTFTAAFQEVPDGANRIVITNPLKGVGGGVEAFHQRSYVADLTKK